MGIPGQSGNAFVDALAERRWDTPNNTFYVYLGVGDAGAWTPLETRIFDAAMKAWSGVADMYIVRYPQAQASNLWEFKQFGNHPWFNADTHTEGAHEAGTTAPQRGAYNVSHEQWNVKTGLKLGGSVQGVMVHELGHAIGLSHPFFGPDDFKGPFKDHSEFNNKVYTAMAYLPGAYDSHVVAPMAFDIAAIQYLYGANRDFHSNNDVYTITDSGNEPWLCIWDTGGIDRIEYGGEGAAEIDLRPATLDPTDIQGAGGRLSYALGTGGFTIAADFTNALDDVGTTTGVIIEDATGGSGNDLIIGNDQINTLKGGRGSDKIWGGGATDYIFGEDDNDIELYGEGGDDFMWGGRGADILWGGADHDHLYGESENDFLYGEGGNDEIDGGAGSDRLFGGNQADTLNGGDDNDVLFGQDGGDTLYGNSSLTKTDSDELYGMEGEDKLFGRAGDDILDGGIGADLMLGAQGNDIYYVYDVDDDVSEVFAGVTVKRPRDAGGIDLINTSLNDYSLAAVNSSISKIENLHFIGAGTFTGRGDGLNNWISGGSSGDFLFGEGGDDKLSGGSAGVTDLLRGGADNDTYVIEDLVDSIEEHEGEGIDVAEVQSTVTGYILDDHVENMRLLVGGSRTFTGTTATGNNLSNIITVDNVGINALGAFSFILFGMGDVDTITGADSLASTDLLDGGTGNDFLYGMAGDDTLRGGDGGDTMDGGVGSDYADYSLESSGVSVDLDRRVYGGAAAGDTLINIENVQGSVFDDTLIGDLKANVLSGGDGVDYLTGGAGIDTLLGGRGSDHITADNYDFVDGGRGFDDIVRGDATTIKTGFNFKLIGRNVEIVFGNNGKDVVDAAGMVDDVTLSGLNGDDTLTGGDGDDYLFGGEGKDTIKGGKGADRIQGERGDDAITGGIEGAGKPGDFFEFRDGWGRDTITDFELGIDKLLFRGVTGLDDTSELSVTAITGTGTQVQFLGQSIMLSNVFPDKATVLANSLLSISGTAGNDELFGTNSDDVIEGLAGNDKLHGGAGNDRLEGGNDRNELYGDADNDTLIGGSTFDLMEGGDGDDTLIGTGGFTVMFGGDGKDTFIGSINNVNTMYGGLGDDTFTGGDLADSFSETEGGDDTVHAGGGADVIVDYYGVNQLYGEGGNDWIVSATHDGSLLDGGEDDDVLSAVLGGNTLLGGSGRDTLEVVDGGAVANIFTGGADADIFIYRQGVGADSNVIVTDYEDGIDHIGLRAFTDRDLIRVADTAEGALLTFVDDHYSPMLLRGISASLINADDFVLIA